MRLFLFVFIGLTSTACLGAGKLGVAALIGVRATQAIVWERAGAPMLRFSPTPGAEQATGDALREIEVLELPIPRAYWPPLRHILDTSSPVLLSVPDGAGLDGRRNLELVRLYFDVEERRGRWRITNVWGSFSGTTLNIAGELPLPNPGLLEHHLTFAVDTDQKTRVLDLRETELPWPAVLLYDFSFPVYFGSQLVHGRSVATRYGESPHSYQKDFGVDCGDCLRSRLFATDFSVQGYDLAANRIPRNFPNQSRCVRALLNSFRADTLKTFLPPKISTPAR
ncbi:MAG: hypothetical protein KDD51_16900 [Bdellovibrionales bacterium]|nr:hypothetical protein [Bdellovibrionales bacterium]